MLGRPLSLDFSGPPPPPEWLVTGLVERGTITVVSADSGTGKSLICMSITVAIMQGRPWLGRKTNGKRVMALDEENYVRVVHTRFHALGMQNEDRPNLRYFLRIGVNLGESDWTERVLDEMADFQPDMLIIDTAMAATAVDANDNTGVARLFRDHLRRLTEKGTALLILHHERKPPTGGGKRHAGHAMMGARQWAGQADAHIAFEKLGDVYVEEKPDGTLRRILPLQMEMPKDRNGQTVSEKVAIVSEHDASDEQYTQPRNMQVVPPRGRREER